MALAEANMMTMISASCKCGGESVYTVGNVPHKIMDKEIIVLNVPHYYCKECNTYVYDEQTDVTPLLVYAYKNNLSEIEWKN